LSTPTGQAAANDQAFTDAMAGRGPWTPGAVEGAAKYGLLNVASMDMPPAGHLGNAAKTGAEIMSGALQDLDKYPEEATQAIRTAVAKLDSAGAAPSTIGATIQRWMSAPAGQPAANDW
jgi:hypothetical protein